MTRWLRCLSLVLALVSLPAGATTLGLNLSNNSVRGLYSRPLGTYNRWGTPYFGAGALYSGDRSTKMVHLGLQMTGDANAQQLLMRVGLGGRLYYADSDAGNGAALGLGGHFTAKLPRYNRISLRARAFFAPNVLAFNDFSQFYEYGVDVDYQVLKRAYVYAGYRQVEAKLSRSGRTVPLDTGFLVGLRLGF